jgi:TPR repeat protein
MTSGSARAAFALAQTYDPEVLAQWQARGIKGDMARARQLYQLASEQGSPEAKERIAALP